MGCHTGPVALVTPPKFTQHQAGEQPPQLKHQCVRHWVRNDEHQTGERIRNMSGDQLQVTQPVLGHQHFCKSILQQVPKHGIFYQRSANEHPEPSRDARKGQHQPQPVMGHVSPKW